MGHQVVLIKIPAVSIPSVCGDLPEAPGTGDCRRRSTGRAGRGVLKNAMLVAAAMRGLKCI